MLRFWSTWAVYFETSYLKIYLFEGSGSFSPKALLQAE
jgi:hypothetical protein